MDTSRTDKLKINFDVVFPKMPCLCECVGCVLVGKTIMTVFTTDLSIDAMDVSGDHQLDVLHSVYKTRLSLEGQPISEPSEQDQLGTLATPTGNGKEEGEKKKVETMNQCGRYSTFSALWWNEC